jgi:hypothetical protein
VVNNGTLTPEQQLRILTKIWGQDREGFVFLPWIPGRCTTREERKKNFHEGRAYVWPEDKPGILAHLNQHGNDDVYFAPCLFGDKRRIEQYAEPERTLWADLDAADPEQIDQQYRPTIAWESSPGRYQAIWLLSKPRVGASWAGNENHKLTLFLGADPSGWDTTQLLRVPGRPNHKPDHRTNGSQSVAGRFMWDNGPRYTPDDFDDLPAVVGAGEDAPDLLDDDLLSGIDRHEVWGRVRLKVSAKVREYMGVRKLSDAVGADRSEILWQIERDLADAGCTLAEIVAVVKKSVWNKYAGRNDEIKRLKAEAAKAIGTGKKEKADHAEAGDGDALEEVEETPKPQMRWLSDAMATRMRRPQWLIRNVWSKGGCGFISGDPKSYKSYLALDMAVAVSTGTPFLNDPRFSIVGGPQPVLYVQEEDGEIIVRDRLEQVVEGKSPGQHWHGTMERADDGQLFWLPPTSGIPMGFHIRSGFTASDPGWQAWFAEMMGDYHAAIGVIDTLGTTAGAVDTDRAPELMAKILRPLRYVSEASGAAIAVVHHNKKGSSGERGGSRMLGSVALHAWVDDALYVHSRERGHGGVSKIRVERESKSSTDERWIVEVPRMGISDQYGTRVPWQPVTGLWSDSEPEGDPSTPRPGNGRTRPDGQPAGSSIVTKIMSMGPKGRAVPTDHIASAMGVRPSDVVKQATNAVANGLLTGDNTVGWTVTSLARTDQ